MASSSSPPAQYDPSVSNIEDRIAGEISSDMVESTTDGEDEDDDDMGLDDIRDSSIERLLEDIETAEVDDDDDDEDEDDYEDASEDLDGEDLQIEFQVETSEEPADDDEDDDGNGTETEARPAAAATTTDTQSRIVSVTRNQLMQLLGRAGLRRLLNSRGQGLADDDDDDEDDDDEDDDETSSWGRRLRQRATGPTRPPPTFEPKPNPTGRDLLEAGIFGINDRTDHRIARRKKLAYRLMRRELGLGGEGRQEASNKLVTHDLIPGSRADRIINYNTRCYSGQFSNDGNFFFSCGQDFKVRMYDTSNPYDWKYYKVVDNPYGQWTITDASLSSDNKWLAYSSISRIVCLAPTDPADNSSPRVLDFSRLSSNSGPRRRQNYHDHFGIWSIRFSGDGRELVAGTGDCSVYVFDIERNQSILRIPGHEDDVNAVCFGDAASPHILYSGSDDTTLKVWDRRSLGDGRAAGVFLGHTEGLTYVDSKGDGRYIISNGKDQTAKLWDLRKVISTEQAEKIPLQRYTTGFEYRMNQFNFNNWRPHPYDCSLVTFRGHRVLKTLIRCHFSPPGSTGGRYVYSGSYDGKVHVWNMDATEAGQIDVAEATSHLRERDPNTRVGGFYGQTGYHTCVRDASWHPDVPMIAATSWNGWGTSLGTCSIHSWNNGLEDDECDNPKMSQPVNPQLTPEVPRTRQNASALFSDMSESNDDDDDWVDD